MTTKLYFSPICPYAQRAMIAIAEKTNCDIQAVEVDLITKPAWYLEINPKGSVPTLQLPNGRLYPESLFITQYIDSKYEPKNQLMPSNPLLQHKILELIELMETAIGTMYGAFLSDAENLKPKLAIMKAALTNVEKALSTESSYAFGSQFTMADVIFSPVLIRMRPFLQAFCQVDLFGLFPRFETLMNSSLLRPSVASTTMSDDYYIRTIIDELHPKLTAKWDYIMYTSDHCPYAQRVELALQVVIPEGHSFAKVHREKLRIPFFPKWYTTHVNKDGKVPTLVTPYGNVLVGSINILKYLSSSYPDSGLEPTDEAQRLLGRLILNRADKLNDMAIPVNHQLFRFRKVFDGPVPENMKEAIKELEGFLANSGYGGPFVCGAKPTIYDFALLPTLDCADVTLSAQGVFAEAPSVEKLLRAAHADENCGKWLIAKKCLEPRQ